MTASNLVWHPVSRNILKLAQKLQAESRPYWKAVEVVTAISDLIVIKYGTQNMPDNQETLIIEPGRVRLLDSYGKSLPLGLKNAGRLTTAYTWLKGKS